MHSPPEVRFNKRKGSSPLSKDAQAVSPTERARITTLNHLGKYAGASISEDRRAEDDDSGTEKPEGEAESNHKVLQSTVSNLSLATASNSGASCDQPWGALSTPTSLRYNPKSPSELDKKMFQSPPISATTRKSSANISLPTTPVSAQQRRMQRFLSDGSSFDHMTFSDIDTPLQMALSNLVKVRHLVAALDAEHVQSALRELDNDDTDLSSLKSSNLGTSQKSNTSRKSLYSLNTERPVNFGSVARPPVSSVLGSSKFQSSRRKRLSFSDEDLFEGQHPDENGEMSHSNEIEGGENEQQNFFAADDLRRRSSSLEGTENESTLSDEADNSMQDDLDSSRCSQDDDEDKRQSISANFSAQQLFLSALDQAIEALLDPDTLMKPTLRSLGTAGEISWLRAAGALVDDSVATKPQHLSSPPSSATPAKFQRSRSRLSSDELSSVFVTNTGRLLVRSTSQATLSGLDSAGENGIQHRDRLSRQWGENEQVDENRESEVPDPITQSFSSSIPHSASFASLSYSQSLSDRRDSTLSGDTDSQAHGGQILQVILGEMNNWNFNAIQFKLDTEGRPLYTMMWAVFSKHDYFDKFRIKRKKFKAFSKQLEAGYMELPYHNCMHAAEVLIAIHYLLFTINMGGSLSHLEQMAAMFAAAIHDFKHPGRSNSFLVKTKHPLSFFYNDMSVLEQMHLAEAFRLLSRPGFEIMEGLNPEQWEDFRRITIRMVLATDLKEHFKAVTELSNIAQLPGLEDFITPSRNAFILEVAIKVADIGHAGKAFAIHKRWAELIQEEFFLQGDHERQLGLNVSRFMDRHSQEEFVNQSSFFDHIALPLFHRLRVVFPPFNPIYRQARVNLEEWQKLMHPSKVS